MMPAGRPRFEVIVAADAADRRLISVSTIRALTGLPSTGAGSIGDTALGVLIDGVLATCAKSCRLKVYRALPRTLAQESVRATWTLDCWEGRRALGQCARRQPSQLLLPWRAPITAISITDGETELVENTDFQLVGAGVVERINGCWSMGGTIVADYVAGWVPLADDPAYQVDGEPIPANLVSLIADQVRMAADRRDIDLNVRQEDVAGVWSGSYNLAGGDAVDDDGLMLPLCEALADFRAPPSIA